MLAISISINVMWVPLIALFSAFIGFLFRSQQLSKSKKQINFLEREMLNSHAEILNLQQELVKMQAKVSNSKSLVVSMKEVGNNSGNPEEKDEIAELPNRRIK